MIRLTEKQLRDLAYNFNKQYAEEVQEKDGYIYHTQGGYTWVEKQVHDETIIEVKEKTMNTENTVVTKPADVAIDCGKGDKSCQWCNEKRKDKVRGKRAEVVSNNNTTGSTKVRIKEGDLKDKEANCPPERLVPVRPEKYVEPEKEKEEKVDTRPPVQIRDFGYGPACSRCHATKGECHGKDCPHAGEEV